jgi:hypothetical protein
VWQTQRTTRDTNLQFEGSNVVEDNNVQMESFGRRVTKDVGDTQSFWEFVLQNKKWLWWSGQLIYQEDEIWQVAIDITQGEGIVVSDGSYKDNYGTAAVILEGAKAGKSIQTAVIVPGSPSVQCAYRSEAAGILAAVQMAEAVVLFHNLPQGQCTMGCDGLAALRKSFYKSVGLQVNIPHYDIIGTTRQEIQRSRIQWSYKHIPGHQTIFPLDRKAAMNDKMDQSCKRYWESSQGMSTIWFENTWSVWINKERIVSDLTTTIREFCSIARAERYWEAKMKDKATEVDWEGTGAAICSVGRMAKQMGLRESDKCPRCSQEETAAHFWTCQQTEANQLWETSIQY